MQTTIKRFPDQTVKLLLRVVHKSHLPVHARHHLGLLCLISLFKAFKGHKSPTSWIHLKLMSLPLLLGEVRVLSHFHPDTLHSHMLVNLHQDLKSHKWVWGTSFLPLKCKIWPVLMSKEVCTIDKAILLREHGLWIRSLATIPPWRPVSQHILQTKFMILFHLHLLHLHTWKVILENEGIEYGYRYEILTNTKWGDTNFID